LRRRLEEERKTSGQVEELLHKYPLKSLFLLILSPLFTVYYILQHLFRCKTRSRP